MCVVVAITDPQCIGGELVLVELKAVIPLKSGDIIIFRSSEISHFNLHFQGLRASLVCHSDGLSKPWLETRNNWQYHDLMKSDTKKSKDLSK